ncbi:MAG: helix-turn-helix transcriptional regulator [Chthonomonadales bacterium]|nr:helix-turn-helix transcriptional regulator [Chthonomonadales bacterium]
MEADHAARCRHEPTRIYTDTPTGARVVAGGEVVLEQPCNVLLHWATSTLENPPAEGILSVRWAYRGQRCFESAGTRFAVDDESYLVFNLGRTFSSTIRSRVPVECYTVCFQPGQAEEVLRGLVTPDDRLLDEPRGGSGASLEFLETAYRHDDLVTPALRRLEAMRECPGATFGWFEEQFRGLLVLLLHAHRGVCRRVESMPASRPSTRAELCRRLHRARDFMEASLTEPVTIPVIADHAWFSPHHFLRLFKRAFGETPHQYLTRRRIERARRLLLVTDLSVTEVCFAVGFQSLGSFSWLFRGKVGVSPEAYRALGGRPA